MTAQEFQNHCEDIATEADNEDWNANAILDRIRGEIGTVGITFEEEGSNNA